MGRAFLETYFHEKKWKTKDRSSSIIVGFSVELARGNVPKHAMVGDWVGLGKKEAFSGTFNEFSISINASISSIGQFACRLSAYSYAISVDRLIHPMLQLWNDRFVSMAISLSVG